jgi:small subunit ribosomal protein S18
MTTAPARGPGGYQGRGQGRPGGRMGGRPRGRFAPRRRVCSFCVDHVKIIDYKNVEQIRRYISDRAKIEPRRKTGVCAKHQRALRLAIHRARYLALIPFVAFQSGTGGLRR